MKTTLDIHDELMNRAKKYAVRSGTSLRAVVEEGLRLVLTKKAPSKYRLPDCSIGDPGAADPLEDYSWQDLRQEIYGKDH